MLEQPNIRDCIDFARVIGCKRLIEVPIRPAYWAKPFQCHQNCLFNPVIGYYFSRDSHGFFHAFKHSVLKTEKGLIDNTPVLDNRSINIFGYGCETEHETIIYDGKDARAHDMIDGYYVYGIVEFEKIVGIYMGYGGPKLEGFSKNYSGSGKVRFFGQNLDEQTADFLQQRLKMLYGCKKCL